MTRAKPTAPVFDFADWGRGRVAVLGIDPASRLLGLVALGWDGTVLDSLEWQIVPRKLDYADRLLIIRDGLRAAIRELHPAAVAYEAGTGPHPAPESDVIVSQIPGWCAGLGAEIVGYTPSQWRKTVCGYGGYDKMGAWTVMARDYPQFLRLAGGSAREQGDVRDAFGLARCWLERHRSPLALALSEPRARMVRVRRTVRAAQS